MALSISGPRVAGVIWRGRDNREEIGKREMVRWVGGNKRGSNAGRAQLAAKHRAHCLKPSLVLGQWSPKHGPWSLGQQHHRVACRKCTFSGPTEGCDSDSLNQKLWGWGLAACVLSPPGDSDVGCSLNNTELGGWRGKTFPRGQLWRLGRAVLKTAPSLTFPLVE